MSEYENVSICEALIFFSYLRAAFYNLIFLLHEDALTVSIGKLVNWISIIQESHMCDLINSCTPLHFLHNFQLC